MTSPDTTLTRPATRGELRDRLLKGESCEVAGYVSEMTTIMLKHWIEVGKGKFGMGEDAFTVEPSPNPGWVIYKPTVAG